MCGPNWSTHEPNCGDTCGHGMGVSATWVSATLWPPKRSFVVFMRGGQRGFVGWSGAWFKRPKPRTEGLLATVHSIASFGTLGQNWFSVFEFCRWKNGATFCQKKTVQRLWKITKFWTGAKEKNAKLEKRRKMTPWTKTSASIQLLTSLWKYEKP